MAQNPDPNLKLTSLTGVTRTLDDWSTMFHLALIVLPPRPEGARWVPAARRIFATFGDADCHLAYCVPGGEATARRVLGSASEETIVFLDPDRELMTSLGLEMLPAFVHLRQDTTLVATAEGWNPPEWQQVARGLAKAMAWSAPEVSKPGDPAPGTAWPA